MKSIIGWNTDQMPIKVKTDQYLNIHNKAFVPLYLVNFVSMKLEYKDYMGYLIPFSKKNIFLFRGFN